MIETVPVCTFLVTLYAVLYELTHEMLLELSDLNYLLIGNFFDMPANKPWVVYDKWRTTHGEMYVSLSFHLRELAKNAVRCRMSGPCLPIAANS